MLRLHLDTIEYEWDEDATFKKDGREYSFVSLKKITTFKENKKYQNLTIKHEHLEKFKGFLMDILGGKQNKQSLKDDEQNVPF